MTLPARWWAAFLELAEEAWPPTWRGEIARKYLLAIGWQESSFVFRRQYPAGPARSFWQIEHGTIQLLLAHSVLGTVLQQIAKTLRIEDYYAIELADFWSASLARALLRAVPDPLVDAQDKAWSIYLRTWRPGKAAPERWPLAWAWASEGINARKKSPQ